MDLKEIGKWELEQINLAHKSASSRPSNTELQVPVTVHREQSVKREKTNKVQQSDVYYQLLS